MDFELTVSEIFENLPSKNYINDCCIGGDEVLSQFKDSIASEMNINKNLIEIYQEDWGWALEFSKDKVTYLLAVNNMCELDTDKSLFATYTQATRKEKILFFDKSVDADIKLNNFSDVVLKLAKKAGFEVS